MTLLSVCGKISVYIWLKLKKVICFLALTFTLSSDPADPVYPTEDPPANRISCLEKYDYTSKKFLFGTLAVIPGAGVSIRSREGLKGDALDWKVGVFPFPFDTISYIPVLSFDYNRLYFLNAKGTSPYFSCGIGAAYIIPYIPLRAGIEFKHGFVDIGAKVVYLLQRRVFPSPEIRAGIDLKF